MKIIVAGGTGFIGAPLAAALAARGDQVVALSRRSFSAGGWEAELDDDDAVVNLAGESVAGGLWTPARKLALIKSRVDTTRALAAAIGRAKSRPKVLINASAVGYYGGTPAGDCPESAPQGSDFLAALCGQWEREALAARAHGARVAALRFGVVLEKDGGALGRMWLPFKLGLGGPLGSGTQPFPWVHRDDAVGAILFALDAPVEGSVNVVAPEPASNAEFVRALGRALHRPAVLPAPAFALRLVLGEMSTLLLDGQRALPRKLLGAGYAFKYPRLDDALAAIARR